MSRKGRRHLSTPIDIILDAPHRLPAVAGGVRRVGWRNCLLRADAWAPRADDFAALPKSLHNSFTSAEHRIQVTASIRGIENARLHRGLGDRSLGDRSHDAARSCPNGNGQGTKPSGDAKKAGYDGKSR